MLKGLLIFLVFMTINCDIHDAIIASFAIGFAADISGSAMGPYMISCGVFGSFIRSSRCFLYMPYMHSESLLIHEVAVELFRANGIEKNLNFEFAGTQDLIAYDQGRNMDAQGRERLRLCVQNLQKGTVLFGPFAHGTKFVHGKWLAILACPLLAEKNTPARSQLDYQSHNKH